MEKKIKGEVNVYSLRMVREESFTYKPATIISPESAFALLESAFDLSNQPEEVVALIALDTRNVVAGLFIVSRGTVDSSLVHPREVFKRALLCNASSIIIAHNHPGGSLIPSSDDKAMTQRIKEAGRIVGVSLSDSLIIARGRCYSFARDKAL